MKKTDRRGFFKQLGMIGGAIAMRKIVPEKTKTIEIETDGIDLEPVFKGTQTSIASTIVRWNDIRKRK